MQETSWLTCLLTADETMLSRRPAREGQALYLACCPEVFEVVHAQVWGVHNHQLKACSLDGAAVSLEQAAQVGPCVVPWLRSVGQAPFEYETASRQGGSLAVYVLSCCLITLNSKGLD